MSSPEAVARISRLVCPAVCTLTPSTVTLVFLENHPNDTLAHMTNKKHSKRRNNTRDNALENRHIFLCLAETIFTAVSSFLSLTSDRFGDLPRKPFGLTPLFQDIGDAVRLQVYNAESKKCTVLLKHCTSLRSSCPRSQNEHCFSVCLSRMPPVVQCLSSVTCK